MQLGGTFLLSRRYGLLYSHVQSFAGDPANLQELLETAEHFVLQRNEVRVVVDVDVVDIVDVVVISQFCFIFFCFFLKNKFFSCKDRSMVKHLCIASRTSLINGCSCCRSNTKITFKINNNNNNNNIGSTA